MNYVHAVCHHDER